MLESLLISTGLPILLDLFKSAGGAVSRKWLGLSVEDQIKLDNANVTRLQALAQLDNPYGTPSQFVIDLRGAFRYVVATVLIFGGLCLAGFGAYTKDQEIVGAGLELAASPFGFIFGERLILSFRGGSR